MRRACRLVMDHLLLDLQPFLPGLLTRPWLVQGDPTPKLCRVLEHHLELYGRVRPPCRQVTSLLCFCLRWEDCSLVIQTFLGGRAALKHLLVDKTQWGCVNPNYIDLLSWIPQRNKYACKSTESNWLIQQGIYLRTMVIINLPMGATRYLAW